MMRRILSAVLALLIVVSMMGTAVFAVDGKSTTLTASLECNMPAMGGCDLAENIVKSVTSVDNEDGSVTITLNFNEVGEWSSAYFSGQTTYVEATGELAYYNGSEWIDATYTTGTATDAEGNSYTYVSSMTFTAAEKAETYALAMCMSGYQFGGSNPSTVSSGAQMTATLTVTWPEEEPEPEAPAVDYSAYAGAYTGSHTYQSAGMPISLDYSYTLTLNADGTYAFTCTYAAQGGSYDGLSDQGSYTVEDGVITLTVAQSSLDSYVGTVITGTVNADGSISMSRSLSASMGSGNAGAAQAITVSIGGNTDSDDETDTDTETSGQYTATGWCTDGDTFEYELTVTVDVADGQITAVSVEKGEDNSEDPDHNDVYIKHAVNGRKRAGVTYTGIPQQILDHQGVDGIDAVSGATYTSNSIVELTAKALGLTVSDGSDEDDSVVEDPADEENNDVQIDISGSTPVDGALVCFMPAMGGCNLSENIVESINYVENEDGTVTIILSFRALGEWSSAYFSGETAYVEKLGEISFYNGSEWVDAKYSTATATDEEGSEYVYVNAMAFTAEKADSYKLGMCMCGYQFGGSSPDTVSSGAEMTCDLTINWNGDAESGETEEPETPEEPEAPEEPDVSEDEAALTSGCYSVDITWSPMASMFAPILEIDADAMTFKLYNETAPETSKGSGTVSYADGVYTLTFENGNTTTFTCEDDVITFTSKLHYGSASFNQTNDNGEFVTYTAALIAEENSGSIAGTYEGTYTYQPTGMPMTLMYSFTMTINENGTYSFSCNYGTDETYANAGLSENGTYTVAGSTITATNENGDSWTGTVNGDGTIEMNRPLTAAMSGVGYGSAFDIVLTQTSASDGPTETPETPSEETEEPTEAPAEEATEAETEAPKSSIISVTSLSDLEPGKYRLTADLSCWLPAMGGCEFGGVLRYAVLNVGEDGSASVTLYFSSAAKITMMYGTTDACVSPNSEISYWNGSKWVDAKYTTGTATDDEGNSYSYVSSMTFPVSKIQNTYKLGLGFGGGSMSAQFGGNSAQMISDGSVLEATLTINWSKTYTNPATGDEANVLPFVILMVTAVCGIAVLSVLKKRKVF